jgi:hypothetical protein
MILLLREALACLLLVVGAQPTTMMSKTPHPNTQKRGLLCLPLLFSLFALGGVTQGKSAEAARKYFVATDEAMDHAESLLAAAAPLVAHLTAVFRTHHELLTAVSGGNK